MNADVRHAPTPPGEAAVLAPGGALLLTAGLLIASLPALFAGDVAAAMEAMRDRVDAGSPYFSTTRIAVLYGSLPLVVLGSMVAVMAPGLLLMLVAGRPRSLESWVLKGFAASLVTVSAAAGVTQALLGTPLAGPAFVATCVALTTVLGLTLVARARRHGACSWPVSASTARRDVGLMLVVPVVLLIVMTPKFFWESFNGDGAHAFEATRLLLHQPVPFWPDGSGQLASFPGMNTCLFTLPGSWFLRLFGPCEAAVRLPFLLEIMILYAAIVALADARRESSARLGAGPRVLIWGSLVAFSLVLSYSASYNPYCADIALPGTQDALLMAVFLGAVLGYLRREPLWLAAFVLMTLLTSPNGLLLVAGLLGSTILLDRRAPGRIKLVLGAALVGGVGFMLAAPAVLQRLGLPVPGAEHDALALYRRFRYVIPFSVDRLAYVAVPCGLYPLFGLLQLRKADAAARVLWLLAGVLFLVFYWMAFLSLHYFVPAMVLPVAAYWSGPATSAERPRYVAACAAAALVCIVLALPAHASIHTETRDVGSAVDLGEEWRTEYDAMRTGFLKRTAVLGHLFPPVANETVPAASYGGSPLAWSFYSYRSPHDRNYVLTREGEPPPSGGTWVATEDGWSLYVMQEDLLLAHRGMQPRRSLGRPMFLVPRDLLFRRVRAKDRYSIIDLRALVGKQADADGSGR